MARHSYPDAQRKDDLYFRTLQLPVAHYRIMDYCLTPALDFQDGIYRDFSSEMKHTARPLVSLVVIVIVGAIPAIYGQVLTGSQVPAAVRHEFQVKFPAVSRAE